VFGQGLPTNPSTVRETIGLGEKADYWTACSLLEQALVQLMVVEIEGTTLTEHSGTEYLVLEHPSMVDGRFEMYTTVG
jgi:hypothetical protein